MMLQSVWAELCRLLALLSESGKARGTGLRAMPEAEGSDLRSGFWALLSKTRP